MIQLHKLVRAASVGLIFGAGVPVAPPLWAQTPPRPVQAYPAKAVPIQPPGGEAAPVDAPAEAPDADTITLSAALSKARLGRVGLALAVGAENETRYKKDVAKFNPDTVSRAAEAFEMATHTFDSITAIGPQTYKELETDFSKANAFADMPPTQAFTLLLASIDDRQRAALTSKTGLGMSDMATATQKQLFQVLFPDVEVSVARRGALADDPRKNLGNLREKASSVHFRVAQEVTLQFEMKGQEYGRQDVPSLTGEGVPPVYDFSTYSVDTNLDKVNGVAIRRDVPNRLKRNDLNYDSAQLQIAIAIQDIKTVGDLVARVAKKTGIELYTDPHYEKKSLTWVISGKVSASASALLRAVAFSLTGAYRKVGTAFVLTEDVTGVGTRRKMIQDFEEECDAQRQQAVHEAEKTLKENPAQKSMKLNAFNDPLAMSAEEEKTPVTLSLSKPADFIDVFSSLASAALPYDKLTPKQQQAVQSYEEAYKKNLPQTGGDRTTPAYPPDFDGRIHVLKKLSIQMVIDGVDGVVATDFGMTLMPLFKPDQKLTEITADANKMFENLPKWTETAKAYSRRGVICKPYTTAEVDASLLRIKAMGFNQMWLTVFENGKARIPGTPFPLDVACDPKTDLLTYAIAEGKKKGITVCPVVNMYAWGADAPAELRLLTVRGEDSAQSAIRRFKINSLKPESPLAQYQSKLQNVAPSPAVFVDPTNPAVQTALTALFQALAGYTGAGDWVCQSLTPLGFAGQGIGNFNPLAGSDYDSMGYNTALRLAFLKKNHCDPIDLQGINFAQNINRANTSLTNYDDNESYEVAQKWDQFRADTHQTALHTLFAAVRNNTKADTAKSSVLFAQEVLGGMISWFDIWSDPKSPFPGSDIFGAIAAAGAAGADSKAMPTPMPASVFFLPKQPSALPKEWAGYDWRSVQLKIMMDMYKGFRTWQGIAVEE